MKPKRSLTNWIKQAKGIFVLLLILSGLAVTAPPARAESASLFLTPNTGSFVVDSTFEVSVYLDTQGESINTIELNIKFPPDKLQLVSSSTGKSIIGIWTSQPKYNNQAGTIYLVGGIPGGINVSKGLISTFTFRVRAVGSAVVKFDNSRVLLNDGLGTEVLTQNYNSIYDLTLPPPAGPVVISDTHPDQSQWYKGTTASLKWSGEGGEQGFSYILSDEAVDIPDDISEGVQRNVVYQSLSEGRHYFHIKSLRNGVWGGTTHYAINVDPTPPADFGVEIIPDARTTRIQPVLQFATTDASSGLDHYELRIVPLNQPADNADGNEFFIEAQSPYVANQLELGDYDVIVRAFDKAGNIREVTQRMQIVTSMFRYISGRGIEFGNLMYLPWWLALLLLILLILLLAYIARRLRRWHQYLDRRAEKKELPAMVQQQISELQKYRTKYGKLAAFVLAVLVSLAIGPSVKAEEDVLPPPVVTTVSHDISDKDIFYLGGETSVPNAEVVIYLQSLESSATQSEEVQADENGEWFYRHDALLPAGQYVLWTQTKVGEQLSPPSPQLALNVETTAINFGATRISFVTLYMILALVFGVAVILLLIYVVYKFFHGRRKHQSIIMQIAEAEASVRRGFAVLNRDIQAELAVIKRAKLNKKLTDEEQVKESQLLKDLDEIEQYLSKEIWDIEESERTGKA
jgi:hypothetical protein